MTCTSTGRKLTDMAPSPLRRLALAGMVALLLGAAPLAQTTEPAQDDSIEEVRTRANAGDTDSQYVLGHMFLLGLGGLQDYVEAAEWFRKAAEQGHAEAQFNLGLAHANGEGAPQDNVEAYKWLNLAATFADASTREEFVDVRDSVAGRLTSQQLDEGQKLAREWFEAHPPE